MNGAIVTEPPEVTWSEGAAGREPPWIARSEAADGGEMPQWYRLGEPLRLPWSEGSAGGALPGVVLECLRAQDAVCLEVGDPKEAPSHIQILQ